MSTTQMSEPLVPLNQETEDNRPSGAAPGKTLSAAARRALEEAAARRAGRVDLDQATAPLSEHGGPAGPDPTRFGDWERKGLAIDFS